MIIVKMWGGLGNQLFQYAFGYMMAREHNDNLYLDISFYKKHQYKYVGHRDFVLQKLNCPMEFIKELPSSIRVIESFIVNRLIRRWNGAIKIPLGKTYYVKEERHIYMPKVPYKPGKINYYDGYWQSGLYFEKYKNELANLFTVSFDLPKEIQGFISLISEEKNSVSVHIRKGDFKGKIGHPVENQYYIDALIQMKKNINSPCFFVFSDDIEWVKNNIDFGSRVHFAEYKGPNGAILDLLCMSKCKHGIMSASTFSWWGNWSKEGIVIAPKGEYYNNKFINNNWLCL